MDFVLGMGREIQKITRKVFQGGGRTSRVLERRV